LSSYKFGGGKKNCWRRNYGGGIFGGGIINCKSLVIENGEKIINGTVTVTDENPFEGGCVGLSIFHF
jgi:hypothetical protein